MRKLFIITLLLIGFVLILPFKDYARDEVGEELQLYMGEMKIIPVSTPSRIAIGNPGIADVTNVTKSEITLVPKSLGNTTLTVWDNFGEQSYRIKVFAEDTNELKRRVDNILKQLNLPDVYTKAGDYTLEKLNPEERTALEKVGAQIKFMPFLPGFSTTSLIAKIKAAGEI